MKLSKLQNEHMNDDYDYIIRGPRRPADEPEDSTDTVEEPVEP
jgi:hypothetical protein